LAGESEGETEAGEIRDCRAGNGGGKDNDAATKEVRFLVDLSNSGEKTKGVFKQEKFHKGFGLNKWESSPHKTLRSE